MIANRFGLAAALALGSAVIGPVCHADQIGDALLGVTQKIGPAVVSIRAVEELNQQANGKTSDTDVTIDCHGVVISSDGLVMCSNSYFSGDRIKEAYGVPDDDANVSVNLVPREIRITVGDEPTEYYATVAASDSNLGLDFLQIRDLKGRTLSFVDLAAAASAYTLPTIGSPTASVTRLDKIHDYATLAIEDRVASIISKPRDGFLPEGDAGGLGMPVCSVDGGVIGVITNMPSAPSTAEERQSEGFARLFDDDISIDHTELIVPVTAVSPLVAEAKAQAAQLPAFVPPVPKPATSAKTNTEPAAPLLPVPVPSTPAPTTK